MWRLAPGRALFRLQISTKSGKTEAHMGRNPQKCLREQHLDRLVQWMVQDASLGR
jgi:hypothetical protein